jgi:uncharacterized protein YdeI (YjbR/CyaY-like superfamily)
MSPTPTPHDVQFLTTPEELRDWFDANHATADELWLGSYRKSSGRPSLTWSEAVDEALCVGWIDGVRYSLDAVAHAQRFTPRRKGSTWSAINVAKVATLTEQGRMRPAGLAAFEARDPARTAIYSYEQALAAFTPEETAAFQAEAHAWAAWEGEAPWYRRAASYWVTSAKRPETRARRLAELIERSAGGERPKPFAVRRA